MEGKLSKSFIFLFALLYTFSCSIKTSEAAVTTASIPEDDEDSQTSASFVITFNISIPCTREDWYNSNIQLFQDRLHSVIATRIDSDCNGCGFTSNYLGNWFVSCHNDTAIYYHAVIKDSWTSSQYPANALLELIRQRYGIIYTFEISTNDMPAIENEEESFVLNSESVSITCRMSVNEMDMTSGGSGIGDSEDECSFTTISVSNNTGTAINDTTTAMDMDTEGSSNGTDEIVIVVTMDPDAGSILDGAEMARGVPMVTIICAVLALSMSHWRALAH